MTAKQHYSSKKLNKKIQTLKETIAASHTILKKDIEDDENMVEFLLNILSELKMATGKLKVSRAMNIINRNGEETRHNSRARGLSQSYVNPKINFNKFRNSSTISSQRKSFENS